MQDALKTGKHFFALIFVLFVIFVSLPGIFGTGELLKDHFDAEYWSGRTDRKVDYLPSAGKLPPLYGDNRTAETVNIPSKPVIRRDGGNRKQTDIFAVFPRHKLVEKLQEKVFQLTELQSTVETKIINTFPFRYEFSEYNMAFKYLLGIKSPVDDEKIFLLPDGMISSIADADDCKTACYYGALAKELNSRYLVVIDPRKFDFVDGGYYATLTEKRNRSLENAISVLSAQDIDILDLRRTFREKNMSVADIFYLGDHHWKTSAALLAAEYMADHMNQNCGADFDLRYLRKDAFLQETFKENFIGSLAKKTGVAYSREPEDFVVFIPEYKTRFTMTIIENNRSARQITGDFRAIHNYRELYRNPYQSNPYALYTFGNNPFIRIVNHNCRKELKIAILKNSYANAVIPYLALQTKEMLVYDERHMTMDKITESLIQEKPDIIIYLNSLFDSCYKQNDHNF